MGKYRRAWGGLADPLRRAIDHAPRTHLILHMPKTGGSSLQYAVRETTSLFELTLPLSDVPDDMCECGAPAKCVDQRNRQAIRSWTPTVSGDRPLVVKFGHEDYRAVDWVRRAAGRRPSALPVVLNVRPCRSRLRSMFNDYWTQVSLATGQVTSDEPLSPHRRRVLTRYGADGVHYRGADGSIDGVAWFTAFGYYGAGVPFFLSEVFDGDVAHLRRELDTGSLQLVATAQLSTFIPQFTGIETPARRRTSNTAHDPAIEAALQSADHLIEGLAARDAAFDRVIGEYLGDPDFAQP